MASFGMTVMRPSKVEKLSIRVNTFQLRMGSGLLICETLIHERIIFLSKGKSCPLIKASPRRLPGNQIDHARLEVQLIINENEIEDNGELN